MNDAHLHILINHFPLIGIMIGLVILIIGFFLKNIVLNNTAFFIFIACALFTFASMYTGEGAEEIIEDMPTIGHEIIHEHEELAEKFTLIMYATGFFSMISLVSFQKKYKFSSLFSFVTLFFAVIGVVLSIYVGNSGGEIRHTEIRETTSQTIKKHQDMGEDKN